jgi:hypothetical protein
LTNETKKSTTLLLSAEASGFRERRCLHEGTDSLQIAQQGTLILGTADDAIAFFAYKRLSIINTLAFAGHASVTRNLTQATRHLFAGRAWVSGHETRLSLRIPGTLPLLALFVSVPVPVLLRS